MISDTNQAPKLLEDAVSTSFPLISMTDFVLEQVEQLSQQEINILQFRNSITGYANFLKQPLTLGMFIPVDNYGNILEKQETNEGNTVNEFNAYCRLYESAKDRCLFKGFEKKHYPIEEFDNIELTIKYKHCYVGIKYKDEDNIQLNDICKEQTIEDLLGQNLQLTEAVFSQLNINVV
ncbi:hypothetical protein JE943_000943 [Flavobacterium psychrophilum]|nr:hypothetical protein [Flavobacterium psychrophilum]